MSDTTQVTDFQRRAAQLSTQLKAERAAYVKRRSGPSVFENLKYPGSIIGAFLTGMIAVAFARYIRFHLSGGSMAGEDPDMTMLLDGAIGAAAGFFIRQMFKFEAKVFLTASNVGVGAMILTMHNFVHYAPESFEIAFSPEWVDEVLTNTHPNTAIFRDFTFAFGDAAATGGAHAEAAPDRQDCDRQMLGNLVDRADTCGN
ncbi:MAG: hypothetical protein QNJ16_15535 [Rhodobacter sp.]|nr:hypothetical protein [Rhodobacter sp.]